MSTLAECRDWSYFENRPRYWISSAGSYCPVYVSLQITKDTNCISVEVLPHQAWIKEEFASLGHVKDPSLDLEVPSKLF